jgi:hypothetical protein
MMEAASHEVLEEESFALMWIITGPSAHIHIDVDHF